MMFSNQLSLCAAYGGGKGKRSFSGVRCCIPQMRGPRTPAKDAVLCTPVLFVAYGGGKEVFGDTRTPAKDCVLCTPVLYSVQLDCCQSFGESVNLNWSYLL